MQSRTLITILTILCLLSASVCAWATDVPINMRDTDTLKAILRDAESAVKAAPSDIDAHKRAGIAAHQLALFSGSGYSDKAVKYLEVVHKSDPENIIMLAYLGSAYALQGRDGNAVMTRISNVNKGVSLLNRAVKNAPEDFIVRIVRASVFFELPPMFKKSDTALSDFLFIESRFPHISHPALDQDLKAEVYYKIGCLAGEQDNKDLKTLYFSKAIEASPASRWAALAKKG